MGVTILCIDNILGKERFSLAQRAIKREAEVNNRVILVQTGIADRSSGESEVIEDLYFLQGTGADVCKIIEADDYTEEDIANIRKGMELYGIPVEVLTKEVLAEGDADESVCPSLDVYLKEGVSQLRRIYDFTNHFLECDDVEQIAKLLNKWLPGNCFFCARCSFLQNLYLERRDVPTKDEEFYILTDRRADGRDGEKYSLKDFYPGFSEERDDDRLLMLLPVQSRNAYFGYLIYQTKKLDQNCAFLGQDLVILNLLIERYIAERRLVFANSELLSAHENVRRMKGTDALTGLLNSQGFMIQAEIMLEKARHSEFKMQAICIDLDRLGNINDVYGHAEGDVAIQTMSHIIQDSLQAGMIAARLGSDEFILLSLVGRYEIGNAELYFKSLRTRIDNYNLVSKKEYTLDINGCSVLVDPEDVETVNEVIDEAFSKKRHIKESRGSRRNPNNYEDTEDDPEEHALVSEIIDERNFRYVFQPIVSARTGDIVAYEALMRTKRDLHMSPLTILKYASMDQRLDEIEYATFCLVFEQMEKLKESMGERRIFINSIPGHYLSDEKFGEIYNKYGHWFPHLVVEITEQTDLNDASVAMLKDRSRMYGFEVAVDDFGTGYSNLVNLLKFLPNYVKIDRALIEGVQEDPKKQHFVNNIIEFAHDNGFLALAEGVENSGELTAVVRMGADLIQGYYTAKPDYGLTQTLSATIRDEIVRANFDGVHQLKKKVFLVNKEKEIFLMHLAMEHYTGVVVSQPELTVHGNLDFMASLTIKIKEGSECVLTLNNVCVGDVDERPIISVGKKAKLTLRLVGNNTLYGNGIHVPEDASVRLEGDGNLTIMPVLADAFGIGADADGCFGDICCNMRGLLTISAEGNRCVAIGGGIPKAKEGIKLCSGRYDIQLAGTNCIGIGCFKESLPIAISGCNVRISAQIASGLMVGCMNGPQDVHIWDAALAITGSGSTVVGIGTYENQEGRIYIHDASVRGQCNGRRLFMIGTKGGMLNIRIENADIGMLVESNSILGLGTYSKDAILNLKKTRISIVMRAGDCVAIGALKENITSEDGCYKILVNEQEIEM